MENTQTFKLVTVTEELLYRTRVGHESLEVGDKLIEAVGFVKNSKYYHKCNLVTQEGRTIIAGDKWQPVSILLENDNIRTSRWYKMPQKLTKGDVISFDSIKQVNNKPYQIHDKYVFVVLENWSGETELLVSETFGSNREGLKKAREILKVQHQDEEILVQEPPRQKPSRSNQQVRQMSR